MWEISDPKRWAGVSYFCQCIVPALALKRIPSVKGKKKSNQINKRKEKNKRPSSFWKSVVMYNERGDGVIFSVHLFFTFYYFF
jgi:hypothetical protein